MSNLSKSDYRVLARPGGYSVVRLGFNPYNWQLDCMEALYPAESYAACATCNESGKAQPVDTVIPTPSGFRRLGDLEVGDRIFGKDGNQYNVTGVYDQGLKEVFRFNFDDGEVFTEACEDHLWWYMTPFRRFFKQYGNYREWQVMSTREIIKKQGSTPRDRGLVPNCFPVKFEEKELLISPYVMGCLIGDGGFSQSSGSIMFSNPDLEILERFESELPNGYRLNHQENYDYRIIREKKTGPGINTVKKKLIELELWGCQSYQKFIPDVYKLGSVEQRIDLLRGLLDTDGSIGDKCNIEYSTSSKKLADDVAYLVRSLGGKARISSRIPNYTYKGEKKQGRKSYRVWVKLSLINPFYLDRKAKKWYPIQIAPERILYQVECVGEKECRCIKVDSPDRTYLTNDFIVTHNTSVVIASAILWHMENFPWSMTVTTSASQRQIRDQLYPVIQAKAGSWPGWKVQISTQECRISAPNGARCLSYTTDDPKLQEGFHRPDISNYMQNWDPPDNWEMSSKQQAMLADNTESSLLIIVDEAKGVKDSIAEAIWRCNASRHLFMSSPNHESMTGFFYDFFHRDKERFRVWRKDSSNWTGRTEEDGRQYNLFHADYLNCPHLSADPIRRKKIEYEIQTRPAGDAWVLSYAYGKFAQSGSNHVFDMVKVNKAMSGMVPHVDENRLLAGLDLSGGGDEIVLMLARGNYSWKHRGYFEKDAEKLARLLYKDFMDLRLKPSQVRADNGGQGDPIIDFIEALGFKGIVRVDFGGRAREKEKYSNIRAEMHFELARRIAAEELAIRFDSKLREQFRFTTYISDDVKGRLRLTPKSKLPYSANELDSLVLVYYGLPMAKEYRLKLRNHNRKFSPTFFEPDEEEIGSLR